MPLGMYMITSFLSGLVKRWAAIAAGAESSMGNNIVAPPAFRKERREIFFMLNMTKIRKVLF
jgi:hypothetical protein